MHRACWQAWQHSRGTLGCSLRQAEESQLLRLARSKPSWKSGTHPSGGTITKAPISISVILLAATHSRQSHRGSELPCRLRGHSPRAESLLQTSKCSRDGVCWGLLVQASLAQLYPCHSGQTRGSASDKLSIVEVLWLNIHAQIRMHPQSACATHCFPADA